MNTNECEKPATCPDQASAEFIVDEAVNLCVSKVDGSIYREGSDQTATNSSKTCQPNEVYVASLDRCFCDKDYVRNSESGLCTAI